MKPSKKPAWNRQQAVLHAGFLIGFVFEVENGDDLLLRNAGWLSPDYMV
jgi:hypothetical protein